MSVKVVIDTTSVREIRGRLLEGPDIDLLKHGIEKLGIKLYVPQVVLEELMNQFRQGVRERLDKVESSIASLDGFLPERSGARFDGFDYDRAVEAYEARLRGSVARLGAEVVPYDAIPHSAVLARAMPKRKPFDEKGKGYQDALIWEGILEHVADNAINTVLVTNNSGDFCAKGSDALHLELVEDLVAKSFSGDCISVRKSISKFNEQHVIPHLEMIEGATARVRDWSFKGFSFLQFFDEQAEGFVDYIRSIGDELGDDIASSLLHDIEISNVYLQGLREPTDIGTSNVVSTGENRVVTILHFRSVGDWEIDIHKADFSLIDDEPDVRVVDKNLNSHMMTIALTMEIDFTVDLVLRGDNGELIEWAITFFELTA